jgi:hypothetical protein
MRVGHMYDSWCIITLQGLGSLEVIVHLLVQHIIAEAVAVTVARNSYQ